MSNIFPLSAVLMTLAISAAAQEKSGNEGSVIEYAIAHPRSDQSIPELILGASVPSRIELFKIDDNPKFVYFYHDGEPIIIDVPTRSIVRIGQ